MSRVTLKSVAEAAGVSPTTASFVLNRTPGQTIPQATADRVRECAAALGYSPNVLARALREGTSRIVLLDPGALPPGSSLDSFVAGLRTELDRHGHSLVIVPGGSAGTVVDNLAPRGIIDLSSAYSGAEAPADGGWIDGLAAHTVVQLHHLAERGHREVRFARPMAGERNMIGGLRLHLAEAAGESLGLTVRDLPLGERGDAASAIAAAVREGATAIAALDDYTALAAIRAVADSNLRVPVDIAVIGFDAQPFGALWSPALTTVRIDAAGYGRRAARDALGLDTADAAPATSSVVIRESA